MSRFPRRRDMLVASVTGSCASFAGCASVSSTQTTTSTASQFPRLLLKEDAVATEEAEYNAELLEQFSASSPAKVRISFRNKTNRTKTFNFSAAPPFSGLVGRSPENPDRRLVLIPENSAGHANFYRTEEPHALFEDPTDAIPDEPTDGCWNALGLLDHEPIRTTRTIKPGTPLSNTYHILAPANGPGCYSADRYYFESNSHFHSKEQWGFELILD